VFEVILSVEGLRCWASDVIKNRGASITVLDCHASCEGESVQNWVEITAESKEAMSIAKNIKGHRQVTGTDLSGLKSGLVGVVKTRWCPVWKALEGQTCAIRQHRLSPDGSSKLVILVSGRRSLAKLMDRLAERDVEVKVLKVTRMIQGAPVTARQLRVLKVAIERGYYDYPRRIRQRELAAACGMSSSALSELLRRAERNVIKGYEVGAHVPGTLGRPELVRVDA